MFDRFTDHASRAVELAHGEAMAMHHRAIGTEHLLLGLILDHDGAGGRSLAALGVSLERARPHAVELAGPGDQPPSGHMPFSPACGHTFRRAARLARQRGHDHIGTDHLTLALSYQEGGVAMTVLDRLEVTADELRTEVLEQMRLALPARADDASSPAPPADDPTPGPPEPDAAARAARAHIVAGVLRALDDVDQIIEVLRRCPTRPEAVQALEDQGYSVIQAHHVLDVQLDRLLGAQQAALRAELAELEAPEDPA